MKKPNTGMVVSSVAHVAVLAYAAIGFTHAKPFEAAPEALPVEVMTSSEFDKLTKGDKTSKKVLPTPKVEAKKIAAAIPEPRPPAPESKENVEAPPPPPEPAKAEVPESPKPEPKPEPPKPEPPKPEPKPEPPKKAEAPPPPEPKPSDLPKPPEKKVEEDKSQAKLDDLIKKEVEQKPQPKPEPKKVEKKPEKPKPKFDPSKIASLVDKRDPGRTAQAAPELSDTTTAGISNAPSGQLALSELSRINAMLIEQVRQCWSPPVGAAGAADLAVVVQFGLSQDGALMGEPRVMNSSANPGFQSAADSALRAVRRCSPLNLPVQFYDHWKFVEINFDPREMMGG